MPKKILVIGDAGRGKTTLADKLSKKFSLPHYSTDDYFWKEKFSVPNDREQSTFEINKIYDKDQWVVDGGTRHLIQHGLEQADIIYLLQFNSMFIQFFFLIKRKFSRTHETWGNLYSMIRHLLKKNYSKSYASWSPPLKDMLEPYKEKIIRFDSFKDIQNHLSSL